MGEAPRPMNHKYILSIIGMNEHGSLIPLFIGILNNFKQETVNWALSEIINNALGGIKPKFFILDFDYTIF